MTSLLNPTKNLTPRDWEVYTLKDAYAGREPIKYVLNGLFEVPSLNIVYGAPGSLKSMLLADLACCVANGANWLSTTDKGITRVFPTTKCGVLWLDFDNGKRRSHDRFAALGNAHNLPVDEHLYYVSVPDPWLDAGNDDDIKALSDFILARKVELVIIDNLAAITGKVDENTSAMAQILLRLRWLSEHANVCLIVIHHARKMNQIGARKGDALRGHSSIEGALDVSLFVERKGQSEIVTITPTKLRGFRFPIMTANFTHTNDEYGQLTAAKFAFGTVNHNESADDIFSQIMAALGEKTMNQTQLTEALHREKSNRYSVREIRNAISTLADSGILTISRGEKNAKLISKHQREKVKQVVIK